MYELNGDLINQLVVFNGKSTNPSSNSNLAPLDEAINLFYKSKSITSRVPSCNITQFVPIIDRHEVRHYVPTVIVGTYTNWGYSYSTFTLTTTGTYMSVPYPCGTDADYHHVPYMVTTYEDVYDDPSDPCEKLRKANEVAKDLLNNSIIKSTKETLTATIKTDANEKGFSFGKDANGVFKTSDIRIGVNGSSVDILATSPTITITGGCHTHTNDVYNVPSPGDIYVFNTANSSNSSFEYYYTFAADGTAYVFTINDRTKFNNFVKNYSRDTNFDPVTQNWKEGTSIMTDFSNVNKFYKNKGMSEDIAFDNATAFVMSKYDMGIVMSKQNATGDFKPMFVKETKDSNDPTKSTYEETTDCNLK